ncbi:MAG: hypothetical protein O3C28_13490 [Proteobacteria bacterium]|nr:hypothetical protein [Pseudomonadota bacterium]
MDMSENIPQPADRQLTVMKRFNANLQTQLRLLVSDEIIEEHRRKPLGQHSDDLDRLLNYFRRPPRFALYANKACREYQVIALPVARGSSPQPLEAKVYTDESEAIHAVFLKHIELLTTD